tara:strand:+ start:715 stop:993 length:279 start_codon:yes stop_codon:yes gene_type:complete
MGIKYKKRVSNPMPSYFPSTEERKWMNYCIDNNIRISQQPVKEEIGRWRMTVNIGPYKRGEVPHMSPSVYDKDTIYPAYYQMCKYYYDKRKK